MNTEEYVAYHGFAYLKGCSDSHSTGLRLQVRLDHEEDYKSFKEFRKHRKGKAGTGLYNCYSKLDGKEEWYGPVELKFIRWSITSSNGAVITFEMDDKEEWQRMRDGPALDAGYETHQLNMLEFLLIELDQEGKPVNVEQKAKIERMALKRKWPKGGAQSKRAARLCQDDDFREWVVTKDASVKGDPASLGEWMRKVCDLDTRAQLDHDPAALERFEQLIARPFLRAQMDVGASA